MSADWTWVYFDAHGETMAGGSLVTRGFPTQIDAENYIGESWKELLARGVESVTLRHGDGVVYGPMSLRAPE